MNERTQEQKSTFYIIPCIEGSQKVELICNDRNQNYD